MSRSRIKSAIEEGRVTVNGERCRAAYRLRAGEIVELVIRPPRPSNLIPEAIPLDVRYEDAHLLVVNKPAGMVVHPAAGHWSGTLVHALLHHCLDLKGVGDELRPGIVHRLDKGTSGLLVVAKEQRTHENLVARFKTHDIDRRYLTVVHGRVKDDEGTISTFFGRHPRNRKKFTSRLSTGKEASTRYVVKARHALFTVLSIYPKTGRTHQIRVHLSEQGHPIAGDPLYSRKQIPSTASPELKDALNALDRQALHAEMLGFSHPRDDRFLEFEAEAPTDIAVLLSALDQGC